MRLHIALLLALLLPAAAPLAQAAVTCGGEAPAVTSCSLSFHGWQAVKLDCKQGVAPGGLTGQLAIDVHRVGGSFASRVQVVSDCVAGVTIRTTASNTGLPLTPDHDYVLDARAGELVGTLGAGVVPTGSWAVVVG